MNRNSWAYGPLATLLLVGCASSNPPPTQPVVVPVPPVATAPAARAPLFVEYVVVRRAWVEQVMPVEPAAVQAWAATPESSVGGDFCWDYVPDTKEQAEAALARVKKMGAHLGAHSGSKRRRSPPHARS